MPVCQAHCQTRGVSRERTNIPLAVPELGEGTLFNAKVGSLLLALPLWDPRGTDLEGLPPCEGCVLILCGYLAQGSAQGSA